MDKGDTNSCESAFTNSPKKAQFLVKVCIPANDAGLEAEKIIEVDQLEEGYVAGLAVYSEIIRTTNRLLGELGVQMGWARLGGGGIVVPATQLHQIIVKPDAEPLPLGKNTLDQLKDLTKATTEGL
jgi:hypothetical protein